jgi:tripartite-type tricarboxylate transporter receptor subunit TctC
MWIFLRLRRVVLTVAFPTLASLCFWPIISHADEWPSRPITIIVGFAAGSPTDVAARILAQELSKTLSQPVLVENKPGGVGVAAMASVVKAHPDGHTLLMTAIGPAVIRPLLDNNFPYDMEKDFTPIALIGEAPNVIITNPTGRFSSISDMIAYAKTNPGKLTIGHLGVGTMGHLTALLFAAEAGIEANFIAYQGSPPVISDVAGGHIDAGSLAYGASMNAVKIVSVATDQHISFLSGIPTTVESGLPNVVSSTWFGVFAPAGLPPSIGAKINMSINAILKKEPFKEQFDKVGFQLLGGGPERLTKKMADDRAKWAKVIKGAGLSPK